MSDKSMIDAKKIFYKALNGDIDSKKALSLLGELIRKKKSKVLKGYSFGVKSILLGKKKKYSFNIEYSEYLENVYSLVKMLGDNRFLGDYEKGYFLAWKDYINYIRFFSRK